MLTDRNPVSELAVVIFVHTSILFSCFAGRTKLVAPCGCTGSAEFTHKKCLQKWTRVKGAATCEICNQGYNPKYIRFRHKLLVRHIRHIV